MHPVLFFLRRNVYRLSLMLGIFCFIEAFMHSTEGTRPNYHFPWGRYVETIAAIGVGMLALAYFTRIGPYLPERTPVVENSGAPQRFDKVPRKS